MADVIVQKKGLLRSGGGPFWFYSSICLPKNMAAALASMDCLSVQSSVSSVAMNATAPVISPFVRIGAMVRAWVVIPSTALSGCGIGIVKGFAVFQKLLQGRGEAALGILFFRHA